VLVGALGVSALGGGGAVVLVDRVRSGGALALPVIVVERAGGEGVGARDAELEVGALALEVGEPRGEVVPLAAGGSDRALEVGGAVALGGVGRALGGDALLALGESAARRALEELLELDREAL
jgi:hypothetical protein